MDRTMALAKPKSGRQGAQDAIALLTEDHREVKKMFKDLEKLKKREGSGEAKAALVGRICMELSVHTRVEEEILYPAGGRHLDCTQRPDGLIGIAAVGRHPGHH